MANQKLTELTATTTPARADLLYVVDSTLTASRQATIANVGRAITKVYNVLDYGADPTGVVECRQAFIDALLLCDAAGGGTVYVPGGTYLVDTDAYADVISIFDNTELHMAADAVIQQAALGTGDDGFWILQVDTQANVIIRGGKLLGQRTGPSAGETGHGIRIRGSTNVLIDDVEIVDCWGDGIYVGEAANLGVTIRNSVITNCRRNGISVTWCEGVLIDGNKISNINGTAPQAGIDIEPNENQAVTDARIVNNHIFDCASDGILLMSLGAAWLIEHVLIQGNVVDDAGIALWGTGLKYCAVSGNAIQNAAFAIYVDDADRLSFIGNSIHAPGYGFYVAASLQTQISGNTIVSSTNHGMYLTGADIEACNICDNVLLGCGSDGSKAAIYLNDADNCQITDNMIRALGVSAKGIWIGTGADNNIVRNNDIFDLAAAAALDNDGAGTITTSSNRTA